PVEIPVMEEVPPEEIPVEIPVMEEVPPEEIPVEVPVMEEWPVSEIVMEAAPEEAVAEEPSLTEAYLARLASNPDDHEARLNLARVFLEAGEQKVALDNYEKLIQSGKLLEVVIEDLKKAVQEKPKEHLIYHLLGDAYMRAGLLKEALATYKEAMAKL
ncbi:MAG: tetratricopeptide repeat protein, partial [Anaerolineae bacterium]